MGAEVIAIVIGIGMVFAVSITMALKAQRDKNAQD